MCVHSPLDLDLQGFCNEKCIKRRREREREREVTMEGVKTGGGDHKMYLRANAMLRILGFSFSLAATVIMALNKETLDVFGIVANYKASPVFEFFVIGNAIVSAYSLISVGFISTLLRGHLLHLFDLVIMVLSMAASSSATAIGYLALNGNTHTGWSQVCSFIHKFCNRSTKSIACSYAGFLILLVICILTSVQKTHRIMLAELHEQRDT